jgi:hypothetical protein
VSWEVQRFVRDSRLPKSVKRRPEVKAVLLALADRCSSDGTNAWPAVATIAAEAEISVRTAHACLATLRHLGLIEEQAPPRQHKPRVWRLNLRAILAFSAGSAAQRAAALTDAQHAAELASPGPQPSNPQAHNNDSGAQQRIPAAHAVAEDPVLQNPLIHKMNHAPAALNSHLQRTETTPESAEEREERLSELRAVKRRLGLAVGPSNTTTNPQSGGDATEESGAEMQLSSKDFESPEVGNGQR